MTTTGKTARRRPAEGGSGLQGEIDLLRRVMRQVAAHSDGERTLAELLDILDALGKSSTRLATLLKTARQLGNDGEVASALSQALDAVLAELRAPEETAGGRTGG